MRGIAALAAVLLLAIAGYRTILSFHTQAIYSAAARDHHVEIVQAQPRKWQTDAADLERLVSSQGLPGVSVATLAPAGYRLQRGRLCLLEGRVFVHLVFSRGRDSFSLFLRQRETPRMLSAGATAFAAEHVAGFQTNSLTALVVSGQSDQDALLLTRAVEMAI